MGTIVGYEGCGDAVLIQVDDKYKIGKTIIYYNKLSYDNIVRAPGEFGRYGVDTVYFTYRPYNKNQDKDLFYNASTRPCLAVYGPFDVPSIVITDYSTKNCEEIRP